MLTICSSKMAPNPCYQLPPNTQAPTRTINRIKAYPKRILRIRIHTTKNNVTPFARARGQSRLIHAYTHHKTMPVVNTEYIIKEISFVCFVLTILIACGRNADVVQTPAIYPIVVTQSISTFSHFSRQH